MHSVLLVVDLDSFPKSAGDTFLTECSSPIAKTAGVERSSENCWLIPLDGALCSFVHLAHSCQRLGGSYKVTFFEEKPKWFNVKKP